MNKIDYHLLLMSVFAFMVTVIFATHLWWVSLPIVFMQFPVLTRWSDKRRHGEGLNYLFYNEGMIMFGAIACALLIEFF